MQKEQDQKQMESQVVPQSQQQVPTDQEINQAIFRLVVLRAVLARNETNSSDAKLQERLKFYKTICTYPLLFKVIALGCAAYLLTRLYYSEEAELCDTEELENTTLLLILAETAMLIYMLAIGIRLMIIKFDHKKLENGLWGGNSFMLKVDKYFPWVILAKTAFVVSAILALRENECFKQDETSDEFRPLFMAIIIFGGMDVWFLILVIAITLVLVLVFIIIYPCIVGCATILAGQPQQQSRR